MSASAIENTELWKDEVEPYVLEQYRESARWLAILKGVIDRIQNVDDAAVEFQKLVDFIGTEPAGYRLDFVAGLVNVKRISGESDTDFLARFKAYISNRTSGTPDNAIIRAGYLSESDTTDVHLLEENSGTFFVYTPEGRQIAKHKVAKLAPAGVLGVPGAAIISAKGNFLVDANGRRILCVAREENIDV